jgi:nucleotide-binding universal stress UspA family protein
MYKKILIPLDGSKRAEAILPHVEELAQKYESELVFMEVVTPIYYVLDPQMTFAKINVEETQWQLENAQEYLEKVKERFAQKKLQGKVRVEQGPVVEAIIAVAEEEDVDLIAIASHGRSGLAQVFYGSVAAGVLQRVDRPLLLIRAQNG